MDNYTLISYLLAVTIIAMFFIRFEKQQPRPRDIMPIIIMCIVSSVGRILFNFIPQVQPSTAIIIIMGIYWGRQAGFMTGALIAIVSNMTLGQGPWTIWQVLAWGVIGFLAGNIPAYDFTKPTYNNKQKLSKYLYILFICIFAFFSAFIFSIITDIWTISTLNNDINLKMALSVFIAGALFNISHAIGNIIFILLLYKPLGRIFIRLQTKYGIGRNKHRNIID